MTLYPDIEKNNGTHPQKRVGTIVVGIVWNSLPMQKALEVDTVTLNWADL